MYFRLEKKKVDDFFLIVFKTDEKQYRKNRRLERLS